MDQLSQLHDITDKTLFQLKADDQLKYRIAQAAAASEAGKQESFRRIVPRLISVSAAMVLFFVLAGTLPAGSNPSEPQMISIAAGSQRNPAASLVIGQTKYISLENPPDDIHVLDSIGEINQTSIRSELFPAGCMVFSTDRDHTVAVDSGHEISFWVAASDP